MFEAMDPNVLLAKGRGIARAVKAISISSGETFTMRTKPGRFRLQKTVYLLKRLKYPAASKFEYNIYLNGPYSPDLAQVYYALEDDGLAGATPAADLPSKSIDTISEALSLGEDFLEGVTTVIDAIHQNETLAQAMLWARGIKPHLGEFTWKEVRRFLAAHPELTRRT
jgi:uncharacterized protein YwgA